MASSCGDIPRLNIHLSAKHPLEPTRRASDISLHDAIEQTKTSKLIWYITAAAAVGGFFYGYDTGFMSTTLVNIGADLGHSLSPSETQIITSMASLGALAGAFAAGLTADKLGRKFPIYTGSIVFVVASVIEATAFSIPQMAAGRFVSGFGSGATVMVIPMYLGELAPAKHRGRMIALYNVATTVGQIAAYGLGGGMSTVPNGWRWVAAIGSVSAILLCCLLPICPETPHQLISCGRLGDATLLIGRMYPEASIEQIQARAEHISVVVEDAKKALQGRSLFWQAKQLVCVGSNLRPLLTTCSIMASCQIGGFSSLMAYSSVIFSLVGFSNPALIPIILSAANFLFTLFGASVVDRWGRRKILIVTYMGMIIGLSAAAVSFQFIPVSADLTPQLNTVDWAGYMCLASIVFYLSFFALGPSTIGWCGTELMPLEVRALGTMVNIATGWVFSFILTSNFLSMMSKLTPSGTFCFYAAACGLGWVFIVFCYPEVTALPLEDVRQVFRSGFGVERANQLQKEMRARHKAEKLETPSLD
ncbi:myo-inositol transporter [Microdochium trichocladiopsis]|uniref:Myo-inositol transporter n=1 Tax=Microdochium trichocladiopsis TaxID=1682393 RepID=A0A9P9BVP3_9PEZI|nr:myo-inositol transporter [Microdochium trichocladiopsis]KAH7033537.1 myo-inositol transporter [Microdochium trichocladiopsis]